MKVLVSLFGSDGGKSGISQYAIHLLREFARIAPDDMFYVLLKKEEKDLFVVEAENFRAVDDCGQFGSTIANIAWHQTGLPKLCEREGYDVVFFPTGRRLPFRAPCPTVATLHDMALLHIAGKYDWLHTVYNRYVLPITMRRLTRVITISESSKQDLLNHARIREDRMVVIPEAADAALYYPRDKKGAQNAMVERYDICPPYILYLSRIEHPGKNHVQLIRAFDRMKALDQVPHQLVLGGSDWLRAEDVHAAAKGSAFPEDIVFTGFVPTEDLPDMYCGADAFVFPSLFEGFGLPILEAMACGVPVACSNLSSMPEVAGDAALLFEPAYVEEIASCMGELVTNETTRNRCIERGLARSSEFSWTKTAELTMAELRKAAASGVV